MSNDFIIDFIDDLLEESIPEEPEELKDEQRYLYLKIETPHGIDEVQVAVFTYGKYDASGLSSVIFNDKVRETVKIPIPSGKELGLRIRHKDLVPYTTTIIPVPGVECTKVIVHMHEDLVYNLYSNHGNYGVLPHG